MIIDQAFNNVVKTKKTVQLVEKTLIRHNIAFESIDYNVFLFNAIGYNAYTNNCTIEVFKDEITVNEKQVDNIYEMIDTILTIERM